MKEWNTRCFKVLIPKIPLRKMSETIHLKNDGLLDIATGRSREEKNWRNKEMLLSELFNRLSQTHRTAETYSEYMAAKKSRQDEIKDVGGFVGGLLSSGRRKKENVVHRQIITLDLDFINDGSTADGIWDDFNMLYGNAACVYSTHKHDAHSPRLRFVLPLDRTVSSDEYIAIARRIAGNINIEYFDPTGFQPHRLMYWSSTSKDAEYYFNYQDGEWLSADEVLSSYHDWKDASEWPVSSRENKIIDSAIKKQGDPLEKPGVIGAWCRTYNIHQVIEHFLSDIYEPCDVQDRYTYKEGSTAAGLVVYDDKYAFSHHGTDPVSGKLCNAFDLVRLHKYGLKDEDARSDTPGNRLPSYTAMQDFATKDPKVRRQLGSEKLSAARMDFDELKEELKDEEVDDKWLELLDVDRKGNYYSTIDNVVLILKNDPLLKNRLAKNLFEKREIALRDLPWRKVSRETKYMTDNDDAGLRHYLEKTYGITGVQKIADALGITFNNNSFHPVRDYLNSLQWDGESRIDSLLIDYLGAEDNDYVRAVTRKWLIAAVARVFVPGIKFDYVLTLVGPQGVGKSTWLKKLGRDWYSDSFTTTEGKEALEQIQGVWIVEIGELAGLRKAEIESIKHFISKQEDRYRVAYGRRIENFPRQCVFAGTTNKHGFLNDPTGNRRFWPVDIHEHEPVLSVFTDFNDEVVAQVWAEAVMLYKQGVSLFLSKELEALAFETQSDHMESDDRTGLIHKYLETKLPSNWDAMDVYQRREFLRGDDELQVEGTVVRNRVCVAEIWCELFGGLQKEMTKFNTKDIHNIMRSVEGWEESKGNKARFKLYGIQKCYIRKNYWRNIVASNQKRVADDIL